VAYSRYSDNRYYANAYGRFITPDPYRGSGKPRNPQSWNRYAYTRGDPVNRTDPTGEDDGDEGNGGANCVIGGLSWPMSFCEDFMGSMSIGESKAAAVQQTVIRMWLPKHVIGGTPAQANAVGAA
jgi:RHS repeat-associated protein